MSKKSSKYKFTSKVPDSNGFYWVRQSEDGAAVLTQLFVGEQGITGKNLVTGAEGKLIITSKTTFCKTESPYVEK